jgi:hypothetical protein
MLRFRLVQVLVRVEKASLALRSLKTNSASLKQCAI